MERLRRRVTGLTKLGRKKPIWLDVLASHPPVSFAEGAAATASIAPGITPGTTTPSATANRKPQAIVYPEDKLRRKFYRDNPFELDRPISFGAEAGKDEVDGEWVVQRQLQLIESSSRQSRGPITEQQAYIQACKEFQAKKAEAEFQASLPAKGVSASQSLSARLERILLQEKEDMERTPVSLNKRM